MMEERVEVLWPVAALPRFHITAPPKIITARAQHEGSISREGRLSEGHDREVDAGD